MRTTILPPQRLYHFSFSPTTHMGSSCFTSSPTFIVFCFHASRHHNECEGYLTEFLIYISPVISNVEHLFMCLLVLWISSLEKCLFKSFLFLNWVVCFLLLSFRNTSIFWILILYQICDLQLFSPIPLIAFHSVDSILWWQNFF